MLCRDYLLLINTKIFCMIKYSLLNSQKQLHFVRMVHHRTDWNAQLCFCMQTNVPDFIEPTNWQSNSPDVNAVDYSILGALQQLVYWEKIIDFDHLKQVQNSCWDMISQELINVATDQWSNDWYWSFIFIVGMLSIISVNSVVSYLLQIVFLL